ncbi:MAG: cytochrome c oxidase subunit II [Dehalococcoidia bacterium]|uniref:cytochrome c oxidase subunit II n=1 Tax=Candidatus Amarobacter glycogenicus TaxID=3140699 RepID=UPI001DB9E128|nr:cytochrome c oxidase subunit II [Dehalococcoidia bacterium]MBK6560491.1 cytochrome c oxidase subunit II [Dehalococcoidia bacterium]MBK7125072.1 cytochrome c oxidase subunit II [Dehalococcoidia bacterium]MBK7329445.1 cytochrome c oxidase subunit II [Dehalococcoidia bacterium]MBK7723730.1 cytochrome c oxidase subunit II [Dehalococcoidia bacterium]
MTRHVVSAVLLWALLTAVGEATIFLDWFPTVGSHEAEDFDRIFLILVAMGTPVFAFVIAVLAYAMLNFRSNDREETGATFLGVGTGPRVWVGLTAALAVFVMIFPGMTGLAALNKERSGNGWGEYDAELVVHAIGYQWFWEFEYPESGISVKGAGNELVLPVDTVIRFDVDAADVLHSYWIPAFRMKIDAVPGRTTFFTVKPTTEGNFNDDTAFRVQCAELCGLDHSGMQFPVRVVSQQEFKDWVDSKTVAAKGQ